MFCKKCGNEINEGAAFCPKCGTALKATDKKPFEQRNQVVPPIVPMVGFSMENTSQKTTDTDSNKIVETVKAFAETIREFFGKFGGKSSDEQNKGNKKRAFIAGAVTAVVLILFIANIARINNFVHRTFSSPEKYYQFVEKKTVKELADYTGEWYDSYVLDSLNFFDKSVEGELIVKLGDDGQEFLGLLGLAGVDVSWLKSMSVGVNMDVKDDMSASEISFALNDSDILSYNMKNDMENETAYIQIPELNKTYIGIDFSSIQNPFIPRSSGMMWNFLESNKNLLQACPERAEMEKLIERYMMLALECVEDVSKSKEMLKVEGVEKNYTVLKVTIDSETMQDMAEVIFEKMRDDKDVKDLMQRVLQAGGDAVDEEIDIDEIYEEFQEEIDEILDDLEYLSYYDDKIVMKVYVDAKGEIKGRSIDLGYITIKSLMPEKGNKFGYELSVSYSGMSMKLTGSGKTNGNKVNGDFQVKYNGAALIDITAKKIDTEALKAGRMNGRLEVKVASKISDVIGVVPGLSIIEDIQINMDFASSKNKNDWKIGLVYNEQDIGSVAISAKTGRSSKISIPSGADTLMIEDEDDIEEWISGIDLNTLVNALKKADIPSEITDVLEEVEDIDDINEALYDLGKGYYIY